MQVYKRNLQFYFATIHIILYITENNGKLTKFQSIPGYNKIAVDENKKYVHCITLTFLTSNKIIGHHWSLITGLYNIYLFNVFSIP